MSMTEQEAKDPCSGQDYCMSCPKHGDDCDGKELDIYKCLICGEEIYEDEVEAHFKEFHPNRDAADIVDNCIRIIESVE